MFNLRHITYLIIAIVVILSAISVGWYKGKRSVEFKVINKIDDHHLALIDPVVDLIYDKKILPVQLENFKGKINSVIETYKQIASRMEVSYVFEDLTNGNKIVINELKAYNPASLMKVPVMLTLLSQAQINPTILNRGLMYNPAEIPIKEESGFKKTPGSTYTVSDLMTQSIAWSDNAATWMLRKLVSEDSITAMELKSGIKIGDKKHYDDNNVSALQYANLFIKLYECELLDPEMSEIALQTLGKSVYKEGIRKVITANISIAQKYGIRTVTDTNDVVNGQLHQFAIVYLPGKPFLIGVMTRGGKEYVRKKIIEDLSNTTWSEVNRQLLDTSIMSRMYTMTAIRLNN